MTITTQNASLTNAMPMRSSSSQASGVNYRHLAALYECYRINGRPTETDYQRQLERTRLTCKTVMP